MATKKFLANINLTKNELQNAVIQPLAADPGSPNQGQIYFNTVSNKFRIYDGTSWQEMGTGSGAVSSVNGEVGIVVITSDDIDNDSTVTGATISDALETLDTDIGGKADTSHTHAHGDITDFDAEVNTLADARADARIAAAAGVSVPDLVGGVIPTGQIPALAISSVQTAADETAHLALTAQQGDIVIRSDESKTYVHNGGSAGTMADWTEMSTPSDAVTSVNGQTGIIVLGASDVGLGNVDNTSDANKPVSSATQTALDDKTEKYTELIGDNSATSIAVTHSLGSKDVVVSVREDSGDAEVECEVVMTSTSVVTLDFAVAPATDSLRVTVIG